MKKIRIDPGHHDQRDNRVQGYSEAATMLAIGKKLKSYAESAYAMTVDLTREDGRPLSEDYAKDLKTRGQSSAGYDLFLSLHSDASQNTQTKGATVYGSIRPDRADPAFFARLGEAVAKATGIPANRPRYREDSLSTKYVVHSAPRPGVEDYYAVLRHARAKYACLLELGFHTNPEERKRLSDPKIQQAIVVQLADCIASRFQIAKRDKNKPDPCENCPYGWSISLLKLIEKHREVKE